MKLMISPDKNAFQPLKRTREDSQDTLVGEKTKLQSNMDVIPTVSKNILKYVKQNMHTIQYAKKVGIYNKHSSDWIILLFST